MPTFLNKTNGTTAAHLLPPRTVSAKRLRLHIYNPNSTTVAGTIHLRDRGENIALIKPSIDGTCPWVGAFTIDIEPHQELTFTPTAAPSSELNLFSSWDT